MRAILRIAACCLLAVAAVPAGAGELRPWTGGALPPLELKDLDGRWHRLADYRGKVVLVNFWATWCEPCRDEMPAIEKLRQRFAGQPFAVLAVNVDEPEARIRRFLSVMPLSFPVLTDLGHTLTKAWGVRVLPTTFVVGANGKIYYTVVGELDWASPQVADRLSELFPGHSHRALLDTSGHER